MKGFTQYPTSSQELSQAQTQCQGYSQAPPPTQKHRNITDDRTKVNEVRYIEFDDFSDDEFGDFGLADETNTKSDAIPEKVTELSLSTQLEKLGGEGEHLITTVYEGKCKAWGSEENCNSELNLEKNVLDDGEVFQPLENPALTPGLEYKWRDSSTYTIMLNTLGIDSKVLLYGENWRSSVPRYLPITPGLLTTQSSPVQKPERFGQKTKDTGNGGVTPDEFDGNNTNPLEEDGVSEVRLTKQSRETPKVITELLAAQNNQTSRADKTSEIFLQKHTSREVKTILDRFPLLNFMTTPLLMFPTKFLDKKKKRPKPEES